MSVGPAQPDRSGGIDLMSDDNYGVRDAVIECADQYLSPGDLNALVDHMWERTEKAPDEYRGRNWLFAIESIARQIKDPALFEKARRRSWGELSVAAFLDIAQVHFDAGDPQSALEWLQKAKADGLHNPLFVRALRSEVRKCVGRVVSEDFAHGTA